jgi:hypothetical protein
VAAVSASGVASGAGTGTASITATLNSIASPGFSLTVTAATGGVPNIVAQVTSQSFSSPGVLAVTVTFTDNGTGNASNVTLQTQTLRTLTGTGTVQFDPSSPKIPISLGNLAVGASTALTFYLDVPSTVLRFVMSETGVDQDGGGVSHGFSLAEGVIP